MDMAIGKKWCTLKIPINVRNNSSWLANSVSRCVGSHRAHTALIFHAVLSFPIFLITTFQFIYLENTYCFLALITPNDNHYQIVLIDLLGYNRRLHRRQAIQLCSYPSISNNYKFHWCFYSIRAFKYGCSSIAILLISS